MPRFAHITLGKAGSQWVKDVLTDPELFGIQKGLRFSYPAKGATYGMPEFAEEPDGVFAGPIYEIRREDWRRYRSSGDRCVVVLRDPRDSIVSWVSSVAFSHVTEEHIRILRPALLALNLRGKLEVAMYTFWESSIAQRSWASADSAPSELIIRYEDIIANERAIFRKIVDFFEWSVPEQVLATVVERLSFATRSGRKPGEKQEFSHYRNGKAGDWRNYFDRDLGQRFEAACPGLLVALGYETKNDWWSDLPEHVQILDEGVTPRANVLERMTLLEQKVVLLEELTDILQAPVEG